MYKGGKKSTIHYQFHFTIFSNFSIFQSDKSKPFPQQLLFFPSKGKLVHGGTSIRMTQVHHSLNTS